MDGEDAVGGGDEEVVPYLLADFGGEDEEGGWWFGGHWGSGGCDIGRSGVGQTVGGLAFDMQYGMENSAGLQGKTCRERKRKLMRNLILTGFF